MVLGELAKQFAQKTVIDALRPDDLSRISDTVRTAKPAGPAPGDNTGATILGQVQAMQRALKEDEELMVLCTSGGEAVRVLEIFVPSWQVFVLSGIDTEKNVTRVIAPVESVPLVCKVMKVQPPAKPVRVGIIAPKP